MATFVNVDKTLGIFGFPTPTAIRNAHQRIKYRPCYGDFVKHVLLFDHRDHDNLGCLEAYHEVCKCFEKKEMKDSPFLVGDYIKNGGQDLNIVGFLMNHYEKADSKALYHAMWMNGIEVVKYLCENTGFKNTWVWSKEEIKDALCAANERGLLMVAKYFHETKQIPYHDSLAINIAREGRLDQIQYINENMPEVVFTADVMDAAAKSGNLKLVRYLYGNRKEGCTQKALELCLNGNAGFEVRFAISRFLWKMYPGLFDVDELVEKYGQTLYHIDDNSVGYKISTATFTPEVMDAAAASGNLGLVKYLYYNRSEGCSRKAVGKVLVEFDGPGARCEIVKFLVEKYTGFFDLNRLIRSRWRDSDEAFFARFKK
ncbi:hypothetical protein HDU76_004397 [Blyttiomyces sp. JEL0837]|nr:hypothetical protein HDU76_004397 [Blyttiomyces sp. JEL0837]